MVLEAIKTFFQTSVMDNLDNDMDTINIAVAALMIEIMIADDKVDPDEKKQLKVFLQSYLMLDSEKVETLIQLAESQTGQSSDIYQFTRLINDNFDYEQRCELIKGLWQLAYADHQLDKYEEYTIRKISDLLYLRHQDFIKAKLSAKP